jgi:hypothetical protein
MLSHIAELGFEWGATLMPLGAVSASNKFLEFKAAAFRTWRWPTLL